MVSPEIIEVITVLGCCTRNASIRDVKEALIWGSVDTSMDVCRLVLVFTQTSLVPSRIIRTKTTAVDDKSTNGCIGLNLRL